MSKPRQLKLGLDGASTQSRSGRRTLLDRFEEYEKQNRAAAAIILGEIDRYGGEDSLMVRWARLVTSRQSAKAKAA